MTGPYEAPATEKQIAYLMSLGVPVRPGLSKRDASDLIDEALKKRSRADREMAVDEDNPQGEQIIHLPRRIP